MAKLLCTYLGMLVSFFAIDMLWLGFVARSFYKQQIGGLLAPEVNWVAAIIFYLLFLLGVLIFVVLPYQSASYKQVLWYGILFGLITYSAYDLTNLATLNHWPVLMVIVDITWGMVITSLVALVGRYIIAI